MSKKLPLCPICGEGHLHAHVGLHQVEYNGISEEIPLHFAVCDVCEVEQGGATEIRLNKREMIAFKKRVDGLLSAEEVRRMREVWGIDQKQAAAIFGGGPVAFSKYENNNVMQSEGMDKLLRAAWYAPDVFTWLKDKAGIEAESCDHSYQKTALMASKTKTSFRVVQSSSLETSADYQTVGAAA